MTSMSETVLGNAPARSRRPRGSNRADRAFADGCIAEFGEGKAPAGSDDAGGDLIMPGLIELHTDHLERRIACRGLKHLCGSNRRRSVL